MELTKGPRPAEVHAAEAAIYPDAPLYIDGALRTGGGRHRQPLTDPATDHVIGHVLHATPEDLDDAIRAASRAFAAWKLTSPLERSRIIRRAAELLRSRADEIAHGLTLDVGRPIGESVIEVGLAADHCDWHAEECRRIYGRVIPARFPNVRQIVLREPVGVCAAFTPWNFPLIQSAKKVAAAIGAGCTVILKGPEEAPSGIVALVQAFHDAGLPAGVLNMVWGVPQQVSEHLIASPAVMKISFTGSVPVGKQLAALAGVKMKRTTMELGGHAPVLVFEDADIDRAADLLASLKFRNTGQICLSPTRFFLHEKIHDRFVDRFLAATRDIRVGPGIDPATTMGPVFNDRRLSEVDRMVADARARGAVVEAGGQRIGNAGSFYAPTVLLDTPADAEIMNAEPFGPVAALTRFSDYQAAIDRANALPYGLASYVFTGSSRIAHMASTALEVGMVTINHWGLALPEAPLGGVKDSGHGSEGGAETFDGYLVTKLVTQMD